MKNCKTPQRQRILFVYIMVCLLSLSLTGRLAYLMVAKADYYGQKAKDVQQRERAIKAKRGVIYDRNGEILAGNKPVSTISVIHNQIKEPEKVITRLSELLNLDEQEVRKRVEKVSSIERIKANVPKETSDKIREENLAGVMVDEDYKRYYPYDTLASRVIGFTGADNQGIIGLEVSYDDILQGQNGAILTMTTARGLEIDGKAEERREPVAGQNLYTSIDSNLQQFATQAAEKVREAKNAAGVRVIMMNPQNGEIYAMVNSPEFSLTKPYELVDQSKNLSEKQKNEELNKATYDLSMAKTDALDLQDQSTDELEKNLAEIEEVNRKVRANLDKEKAEEEAKGYKVQYDNLSLQIDEVRKQKYDLLNNADLPLPELSIDDNELTYKGKKWDSMSGSDQLRVSTAIVRKLNPDCGFVLLDKLEQMDLKTLTEFNAWLEQEGLQAIATRVSTGDECSVIIEDGYVKEDVQSAVESSKPQWKAGEF